MLKKEVRDTYCMISFIGTGNPERESTLAVARGEEE